MRIKNPFSKEITGLTDRTQKTRYDASEGVQASKETEVSALERQKSVFNTQGRKLKHIDRPQEGGKERDPNQY